MNKIIKKGIILITLIFSAYLTSNISHAAYSRWNNGNEARITFMGNELTFTNNPYVLNNEIMVPALEFLELIGANVTWNANNNELICYKDNIFLRVNQNNFSAFVNGKSKNMERPAFLSDGVFYLPIKFLVKNYELSFTALNNSIDIDYKQARHDKMTIGYISYRKYSLLDKGFSVFVPEYYSYTDGVFTYDEDNSRVEIINSFEEEKGAESRRQMLGNYLFDIYKTEKNGEVFYDYAFNISDKKMSLRFSSCPTTVAESISSTVYEANIKLNTMLEHYYEMPAFFKYGVEFKNEIHSNILVENSMQIEGKLSIPVNGKLLFKVKKDNKMANFEIPITKGLFKGKIFTPFGLGRHALEMSILSEESNNKKPEAALKLTVLNESNTYLSDILQTKYLNYDNNDIYNLINQINESSVSQYSNAKGIYKWIVNNYDHYESDSPTKSERKMSQLAFLNEKLISEAESCILYAGFLRAFAIPTKIAHSETVDKYWVEAYINGKWHFMGINDDIRNKGHDFFYLPLPNIEKKYIDF